MSIVIFLFKYRHCEAMRGFTAMTEYRVIYKNIDVPIMNRFSTLVKT